MMDLVLLLRAAFNYDHGTGIFTWKDDTYSHKGKNGEVVGGKDGQGYIHLPIHGKSLFAHRAAWAYFYGKQPSKMVDHINGDKSDNRISNLRLADHAENTWNRIGKNSISGAYIVKKTGRWRAMIRHRGKKISLGSFKTEAEARQVYQNAAMQLRGEFHE